MNPNLNPDSRPESQFGNAPVSLAEMNTLIDEYIALNDSLPGSILKYHHLSQSQQVFYYRLSKQHPPEFIPEFHRAVMTKLLLRPLNMGRKIRLPESVKEILADEIRRINEILEHDKDYVFDWSNDNFAKDMGICTSRLIPVGAQLVEVTGIPRQYLLREPRRLFGNMVFFMTKLQGSKPMFHMHTHLGNLKDFNPEGWKKTYIRLGQLLELNRDFKGVQCTSWFFDPQLKSVSPNLSYLVELPCQHGARTMFVANEDQRSGALSKSKTRNDMFKAGKYLPRNFILVWPRKSLIAFGKNNMHVLNETDDD